MLRRIGKTISQIHRTLLIFAHDLLMVPVAWLGSYWFRFNLGQIPEDYWAQGLRTLPWVMRSSSARSVSSAGVSVSGKWYWYRSR